MNEGKRFDVLDSWRGIAACLVALYHFRTRTYSHLTDITLLRNSYLFVDFFFVLSRSPAPGTLSLDSPTAQI